MEPLTVIARATCGGIVYVWTVSGSYGSVLVPWRGTTRPYFWLRVERTGTDWESDPQPGTDPWARLYNTLTGRAFSDAELLCEPLRLAEARVKTYIAETERALAEATAKAEAECAARAEFRVWIAAVVSKLKGTKRTLSIPVNGDVDPKSVNGVVYHGLWAIHTTLGHARGVYTVTHAPTGLAVKSGLTMSEARIVVARLFTEAPAWGHAADTKGLPHVDSPDYKRACYIARNPYEPLPASL